MTHPISKASSPAKGILLKLMSLALFVIMGACVKAVSDGVPTGQAVFFRSFFGIMPIMVWLYMQGKLSRESLRMNNPWRHLQRGLIGVSGVTCNFIALGMLPLPEVTVIGYAMPMFVTILAALFLGERIRLYRIGAIILGLSGVMIIMVPRLTAFGHSEESSALALGASIAFVATIFMASAQVTIRSMVQTERTAAIVFYFAIIASLASLMTAPFGWVWPSPEQWLILVALGVIGSAGQIMLTTSYHYAEAAVIANFEYVSIIFAATLGYFLFGEVPTLNMLIGGVVVVGAGMLIIWRERALARRKALGRVQGRAAKAMGGQG